MINRKELTKAIEGFLDTLSRTEMDEWYACEQQLHELALTAFVDYLFKTEMEKESRYAKFIELYAEFGEPK